MALAVRIGNCASAPCWLWDWILYHAFAALHTWANRSTGISLFLAPVLYRLFGLGFTGSLLGAVAFLSACEGLVILLKSKELNRDCKGIFRR